MKPYYIFKFLKGYIYKILFLSDDNVIPFGKIYKRI